MKINWGTGIACFYSLFVIIMISMVVLSAKNPSHLVQENYYEKDINYEVFRKKREKGAVVDIKINVVKENGERYLMIAFPDEMSPSTGEVTLFRPSNKMLDTTFALDLDEDGVMKYQMGEDMVSGLWKLHLDWQQHDVAYFKEQTLYL